MEFKLQDIQSALAHQRHDPELNTVYICFSIIAGLNLLSLIGMYNLRLSLVAWFLKHQIKNGRQPIDVEVGKATGMNKFITGQKSSNQNPGPSGLQEHTPACKAVNSQLRGRSDKSATLKI